MTEHTLHGKVRGKLLLKVEQMGKTRGACSKVASKEMVGHEAVADLLERCLWISSTELVEEHRGCVWVETPGSAVSTPQPSRTRERRQWA